MSEEVFAPILSVVPFRSLDEAITQVNAVPFGLAAGVFTQNRFSAAPVIVWLFAFVWLFWLRVLFFGLFAALGLTPRM